MAEATAKDHADAAELAAAAGRLLIELRGTPDLDQVTLKNEGDRQSNDFILAELRRRHPGDAVLSEEAVDDHARLDANRVWIVDPLDGTREFGEVPRDDWAVHIALVVDGELAVGAVALPARGLTL